MAVEFMRNIRLWLVRVICIVICFHYSGCDGNGIVDPDPDPIINVDPPPDAPLIAFTVYYEGYSEVVIAPLDKPWAYRKISPGVGQYYDPRFSPSKLKVLFRDPWATTYLYDVKGDSSYVLREDEGHGGSPIIENTFSVVLDQDEEGFLYHSERSGVNEAWDVWRYSITDRSDTPLLKTHALQFGLSPDIVVVYGWASETNFDGILHLFDLNSRSLTPINNPFLVTPDLPKPSTPRVLEHFVWHPEKELIAVSVRETSMEAWQRYIAATNMDGSQVIELTPRNYRNQNPRWGPGNTVFFERFTSREDYYDSRNQKLMVLDMDTNTIREFVSRTSFTSAIGVGSCDI